MRECLRIMNSIKSLVVTSAIVSLSIIGSSVASASESTVPGAPPATQQQLANTPAPPCMTASKADVWTTVVDVNNQCRERLNVRVDLDMYPDTSCQTFEPFRNGKFDETILWGVNPSAIPGSLVIC